MKYAFTTLEMHGIENRWDPLGQLFTDDNSKRGSLMRSARRWLQEYCSVGSLDAQLQNDEQRRSKRCCSSWITLGDERWQTAPRYGGTAA